MRGKRAKLLRQLSGYDMKKEREQGRMYRLERKTNLTGGTDYKILCSGAREYYKVTKLFAKRRKKWEHRNLTK